MADSVPDPDGELQSQSATGRHHTFLCRISEQSETIISDKVTNSIIGHTVTHAIDTYLLASHRPTRFTHDSFKLHLSPVIFYSRNITYEYTN